MFDIIKIGEKGIHDTRFCADRPNGYTVYLILLVRSRAQLWMNDEWIQVQPDSAIVFQPDQPHRYRADDEDYMDSWMWANFQPSLLDAGFPYGAPVNLSHPEAYYSLFHILCNAYFSTTPRREMIIDNLGSAFLQMLSDEVDDIPHSDLYYTLVRIRREIYNHPEYDWNVPGMARKAAVSTGYLQKIYKEFFGITCNNEIISSRIQAARELLNSTNLSVEDIAQTCGYQNTEHFIRQFRSYTGYTPGHYRMLIRCGQV